jgi:hypothetical protein
MEESQIPYVEDSGGAAHYGPEFDFTMRPWSARELRDRLGAAGFGHVDVRPGVGRAPGDRLFVTAQLRPLTAAAIEQHRGP